MRRPIRSESRIATGTGIRGFCISIPITRISITVTSMNTLERVRRPEPGRSK
jgi:hypothetical protein